MKPFQTFAKKFPWLYALLGVVVVLCAVRIPRSLLGVTAALSPQKELLTGIGELIAAAVVFAVFGLFVGYGRLKFSGKGMKYGFRFLCVLLIVTVLLFLGVRIAMLISTGYSPVWQKIIAFFLLATVGIVEEFTFRGMTFGGLMKILGRNHRGTFWACLISGLLFGFIHVIDDALKGSAADATAALQMIGKTLSAGMFGFVLAVIYLKTKNIWVAVALHSVYDSISFFTTLILTSAEDPAVMNEVGHYVASGDVGKFSGIVLLVDAAIQIPFFIKALKELKKMQYPQPCPLDDEWYK